MRAWHYAYDALDRTCQGTAGTGRTRTVGQVAPVNITAHALDATTWTYETDGRLASVANGTDRHVDTTYDNLGRTKTSKVYAAPARAPSSRPRPRPTTSTARSSRPPFGGSGDGEGTNTISYSYVPSGSAGAGQVDLVKSGSTVMTDIDYNADGTIATRKDTNPVSTGTVYTTTYGNYDWAKRALTTTAGSVFSGTAAVTYRLDGLIDSRSFPNGETTAFAYDAAKRPLTITKADGGTFAQTYDRDNNVLTTGRSLTGPIAGSANPNNDAGANTATFAHDALNRLIAETGLASARTYATTSTATA